MKQRIFLLIIIFLLQTEAKSQMKIFLNYNNRWEISTEDIASYFRIAYFDTVNRCFMGKVTDHYPDSSFEMTGFYLNGMKNGLFTFYYPNSTIKKKGNFLNDIQEGDWEYYYSNGQLNQKLHFKNGDFSLLEFYDSLGNDKMTQNKIRWNYEFIEHGFMDTIELSGIFKNGLKNGEWIWKWNNGPKIMNKTYINGEIIDNEFFAPRFAIDKSLSLKNFFPEDIKFIYTEYFKKENEVLNVPIIVEDMPVPIISGISPIDAFNKELEIELYKVKNLVEKPTEIFVTYTVNEDGKVKIERIKGSVENSKINEIITQFLLKSSWRSGKRLGLPVKIVFNGIINFNNDVITVKLIN